MLFALQNMQSGQVSLTVESTPQITYESKQMWKYKKKKSLSQNQDRDYTWKQ